MKPKSAVALCAALILSVASVGTAQESTDTAGVDTYCLTVDVPADTVVDESTILDDPRIVTVVELVACGGEDGNGDSAGVLPAGSEVTLGKWNFSVEGVNNSAWKRVKKENMFNDPPPRGSRIVMVSMRVGHDERGTSYDPAWSIEYSLFGPDDAMEEYDDVVPGNSLFGLDGIPGGRSKTFMDAWIVPNKVKLKDLVLYVESDDEYAEIALGK